MRRAALIAVLIAVVAPASARAQAPPLRAKLTSCLSGPDATDRSATFTGSMPRIKGTKRMWMRFDLQVRIPPATSYKTIKVSGLGVWQKSASGKSSSGFVFNQRVQALSAPGAYRVTVRFRWYGRSGRLLRSTSRQSTTCTQPDQRPDLHAGDLGGVVGPGAGQATYYLGVSNEGRTAAGAFDVGFTIAGAEQPDQRVDGLAPGADQTLTFVGPRCAPGTTLRFVLDARDEVDESVQSDDVVDRPCPFVS